MNNKEKLEILRHLTKLAIAGGAAQSTQQGPTVQDTQGLPGGIQGPIAQSQQVLPNRLASMQGLRLVRRPQIGNAASKAKKKIAPSVGGMGSGMPKLAFWQRAGQVARAGINLFRRAPQPKMPKGIPQAMKPRKLDNFRAGFGETFKGTKAFRESRAADRLADRTARQLANRDPGLLVNPVPSARELPTAFLPKVRGPRGPRTVTLSTAKGGKLETFEMPKQFRGVKTKNINMGELKKALGRKGFDDKNFTILKGAKGKRVRMNPKKLKGDALVTAQKNYAKGMRRQARNELAGKIGRGLGSASRIGLKGGAGLAVAAPTTGALWQGGQHLFQTGGATTKNLGGAMWEGAKLNTVKSQQLIDDAILTGGKGGGPIANTSAAQSKRLNVPEDLGGLRTRFGTPQAYNRALRRSGEHSKMVDENWSIIGPQALRNEKLFMTPGVSKGSLTPAQRAQEASDKAMGVSPK